MRMESPETYRGALRQYDKGGHKGPLVITLQCQRLSLKPAPFLHHLPSPQ